MIEQEIRTVNCGLLIGKFISTEDGDVIEHYKNGRTDYIKWEQLESLHKQFLDKKNR